MEQEPSAALPEDAPASEGPTPARGDGATDPVRPTPTWLAVPRNGRSALGYLRRTLQPFLDAYWAVGCTLDALSGGRLPEAELIHLIRLTWERLFLLGRVEHFESGSQATFRTALSLLVEEGYLQRLRDTGGKGGPVLEVPAGAEQQQRRRVLAEQLRQWRCG